MAKKTKRTDIPFAQKLVLNAYMLDQIGFQDFESVAKLLSDAREGWDENQISYFYKRLTDSEQFENSGLNKDILLAYDMNITKHTKAMQGKRKDVIKWKYFQYLCLLFVEIYLDKFFNNKEDFLNELNHFKAGLLNFIDIPDYTLADLSKIAIWNATGSGKTLLMHMNILQYRYYMEKYKKTGSLNKILLITPNEGLSKQHLSNFNLSRISAEIFDKKSGQLFSANTVEIIEITKLKDEGKEKTVSVDSFENNNLVLIDEVHRGTQGKEFKKQRDKLSTEGFAFEYSATLGQAVKAANNDDIENEYAKATIFDYSYKWFYGDGYGKDYKILNLADDSIELTRKKYLTGCLLSYFQQLKVWEENKSQIAAFNIEKPLWIFVGGTVTAVRTENKRAVSDVLDILLFLEEFVRDERQSIELLNILVSGKTGLLDSAGKDIFSNSFSFVGELFGKQLYDEILQKIFHAKSAASLHVENLSGASGEISLRIGTNEAFGLINVGDSAELIKLCKTHDELIISDKNFSGSVFDSITSNSSPVNVLIGSKKFTEGWDCFRVSTMGLMNIGKSEGSEIIQLFGRGVRLKGYENSLKRTSALQSLNLTNDKARIIRHLEILNIFGVRADYMRQFREYLENEGLPSGSNVKEEYIIPVLKSDLPKKTKLKVIKLKEGLDFKKQGDKPNLEYLEYLTRNKVVLDWYPKIQAIKAKGVADGVMHQKEENVIPADNLAFIDWNRIYLEMQDFKAEKSWYNLDLSVDDIKEIFRHNDWYTLYIPREDLYLSTFSVFDRTYDIIISLLKKYCEKFYFYKKSDWEKDKLVYQELTPEDSNFIDEYRVYIQESAMDVIHKISQLIELVKSGQLKDFDFPFGKSMYFQTHLYNPILSLNNNEVIEVKPVALNDGETKFVEQLREYYNNNKQKYANEEFYLLRNRSKGNGMGFFEEGNFYPDFILWHVKDNKQYITFIDPKGIRNLDGKDDPKITFHKRIKILERDLNDDNVILNSAIISNTNIRQVNWRGDWNKEDFEDHNVFFQDDDDYIRKVINIGAK